jgi:hypothetical protein
VWTGFDYDDMQDEVPDCRGPVAKIPNMEGKDHALTKVIREWTEALVEKAMTQEQKSTRMSAIMDMFKITEGEFKRKAREEFPNAFAKLHGGDEEKGRKVIAEKLEKLRMKRLASEST